MDPDSIRSDHLGHLVGMRVIVEDILLHAIGGEAGAEEAFAAEAFSAGAHAAWAGDRTASPWSASFPEEASYGRAGATTRSLSASGLAAAQRRRCSRRQHLVDCWKNVHTRSGVPSLLLLLLLLLVRLHSVSVPVPVPDNLPWWFRFSKQETSGGKVRVGRCI